MQRAAEEYQVPCSTLHDRGSGKVYFGAKSGPARYLNYQEESKLVNFLCCVQFIVLSAHVTQSMKNVGHISLSEFVGVCCGGV